MTVAIGWPLLAGLCWAATAAGQVGEHKEYFVSPAGTPDGVGSRERPLDLATALSQRSPARPGDTIWLLGGTYTGAFVSRLAGTQREPIIIRQHPGARATIDCRAPAGKPAPFSVEGEWTTFWGFEVTCTDPTRVTQTPGSHPQDIQRGGIDCRGAHIHFVNLVVHDCGCGLGFWSAGEGGEIYGCIIYNNGWQGPDRGHGHAIYTQNRKGTKRLIDNIMFNQFGYGIHAYGSAKAALRGFHVEGNVCFNSGSLSKGGAAPNILIGGGCPAGGVRLISNFTYHGDLKSTSVQLGYSAANDDATVEDNYFVGGVTVRAWQSLSATGNTFVAAGGLLNLVAAEEMLPGGCRWDRNTYHSADEGPNWRDFFFVRAGKGQTVDFATWRGQTGLDKASKHFTATPRDVHVFIRPNRYQLGRAHIIVYNWPRRRAIEVDLKDYLKIGAGYELVNVEDYYGKPVLKASYDGKPVRVPLGPVRPAAPVGLARARPTPAGPTFSVFVLKGA